MSSLSRPEKLDMLKKFFLNSLAEDPQDGTEFDCDILDAIESLESRYTEMRKKKLRKQLNNMATITQYDLENLLQSHWKNCDGWNLRTCDCFKCRSRISYFRINQGKSIQRNIKHLKSVVRLLQLRQD